MKAILLLTGLSTLILGCQPTISVTLPGANTATLSTAVPTSQVTTAVVEPAAGSKDSALAPIPDTSSNLVTADTLAVQSQAATVTAAHQTPTYSGQIGHYDLGRGFSEFLFDHDGLVVYLNVFFTDEPQESPYAVSYGEDWFSLWTDCSEQTAPGAPSAAYCTGVSFNVNPDGQPGVIWGYNQGAHYLKGYWLVTAHPGMHQGQLSLTLSGAPAQREL